MTSESSFYSNRDNRYITGISENVRRKVYELFVARFGDCQRILDVGVTCERNSPEANFLEKWFPHKHRITAAGIEDASFLEQDYPGMKFVALKANQPLPFADNSFDVVFSHAVVEHVVDPAQRRFFLSELLRVARHAFVTTPNKFFPIETHTKAPLVHALSPALFNWMMDRQWLGKFYNRHNLDLLSRSQFLKLAQEFDVPHEMQTVKCFGWPSNLILITDKRAN